MLSGVRRSPKLLKRMLAQPTSSETPKRSDSAPKRPVQPSENECSSTKRQKTEKDFVDSAIRAVSTDEYLSGVLNLALCQSGGGSAEKQCLVVVTTKTLYYSEPAKHMSHLRLVLSGDGSYYIQVFNTKVQ